MNRLVAPFALLALSPLGASAQDADPDKCKDPMASEVAGCFSIDLSMPDSPGLMIVGLGTDDIVRPTTPRNLGAALSNGIDEQGNPVSGFAIDFAPYKLLEPATTRQSYEKSPWLLRPLWNTQMSVGIGKATDENDKSLRTGIGFSTVLWRTNASDPVLDVTYQKCLTDRLDAELSATTQPGVGSQTSHDPQLAKCYETFSKDNWNATALTLGYAQARVSDTGSWDDADSGASGLWATFSYGFDHLQGSWLEDRAELVVAWRELDDERIPDAVNAGAFVEQDSRQYGVQLRIRGERMNVFGERSWAHLKLPTQPKDETRRYALGIEWKLTDSTWIVLAFGGESGRRDGADQTSIKTGLKFGTSHKPTYAGL